MLIGPPATVTRSRMLTASSRSYRLPMIRPRSRSTAGSSRSICAYAVGDWIRTVEPRVSRNSTSRKRSFVLVSLMLTTKYRFLDVLFLDTLGSTVLIQSPTAYAQMGADAPPVDRDLGLIWGSLYDRDDAVSILDRATVAGGPISVDPEGNPHLLVYAAEGAPNCQMTYHPCYWLDRTS